MNANNDYGRTLLHLEAKHGHQKVTVVLLDKDIDVNTVYHEGRVALHWAARGKRWRW